MQLSGVVVIGPPARRQLPYAGHIKERGQDVSFGIGMAVGRSNTGTPGARTCWPQSVVPPIFADTSGADGASLPGGLASASGGGLGNPSVLDP